MSVYQFCLLVIVATACGWLIHSAYLKFIFWPHARKQIFGISIVGLLPANQAQLAQMVAASIAEHYLDEASLAGQIKYDQLSLQLKPQIEGHVDAFLKDKLPPAFPMLFKLMGEKTLLKFKGVFMDEVEAILPALMKEATNELLKNAELERMIEKTLSEIPMARVEQAFVLHAAQAMHRFKWMGAAAGFIVGLVQSLLLMIIS